jgi:transposase
MFIEWSKVRVFVRPGATDMRKQISGLAVLVSTTMAQDPLCGHLYMFTNKDRRLLKVLYWDRNGFCMWQKRLERDRFPWPKTQETAREINVEQLRMLLSGIDFWNAYQRIEYTAVI